MRKKGGGNYKDGLRAGYTEYRYGTKPKKVSAIYSGKERQRVVGLIMDALQDWRSSKFENEGAVRHGVRSALCLKGFAWDRADLEAASLINGAFLNLGYSRPSWDEGQSEYSTPSENCKWCGVNIPDDMFREGSSYRFCSDICARSALQFREFRDRDVSDAAYGAAWSAITRSKNSSKICLECGKQFRPFKSSAQYCSRECINNASRLTKRVCLQCCKSFQPRKSTTKYCSDDCARKSKRLPTKLCKQCGAAFTPRTWKSGQEQMFCGKSCQKAHGFIVKYNLDCQWCCKPFRSSLPYAKYCSPTCKDHMQGVVSGRRIPKKLSAPVFDYYFKRVA